MLLTLDEIKAARRYDQLPDGTYPTDPAGDRFLTILAHAAQRHVESSTGRKLCAPPLPDPLPDNALVLDGEAGEDVRLAMLLLIGHWDENREAVNIGNITSEVPLGFAELIGPYRWFSL
ncbi:Phage gp6-like head-tail connector protein [compost metagenome]